MRSPHIALVTSLEETRTIWRLGPIFIVLFGAVFSRTYHNSALRYFRLAIAIPALLASFSLIAPSSQNWNELQQATKPSVQVKVISCFAALRVLEICVASFWDLPKDTPRWIMRKNMYEGTKFTGIGFSEMPIPRGLKGRVIYALDLLLTVRGSSWLHGRVWNWAPERIKTYEATGSRIIFVFQLIQTLLWQYIWLDIANTVVKSHNWTTVISHPLTSLPIIQQIIYTTAITTSIIISMSATYYSLALFCVLFLASHPYSWPPLFSSLFSSSSLVDFWTNRWHTAYHYQFTRIAAPATQFVSSYMPSSLANISRSLLPFISTLIHHLILLQSPSSTGNAQYTTLKFILAQPLGILLERLLNATLINHIPHKRQLTAQKLFMWFWLVLTARWYCDGWGILVAAGDMGPSRSHFSIVQGLLFNDWVLGSIHSTDVTATCPGFASLALPHAERGSAHLLQYGWKKGRDTPRRIAIAKMYGYSVVLSIFHQVLTF